MSTQKRISCATTHGGRQQGTEVKGARQQKQPHNAVGVFPEHDARAERAARGDAALILNVGVASDARRLRLCAGVVAVNIGCRAPKKGGGGVMGRGLECKAMLRQ